MKEKRINYLRKTGDYKNLPDSDFTISMKKTAQIIYSYNGNPHKVGNQRKKLYRDYYDEIFPESLDFELVERLIRLYFQIDDIYKKSSYKTYDQKVFYIIYMLSSNHRKVISDRNIKNKIIKLETAIMTFDKSSKLPEARKILKNSFKKFLDAALKADH